MYIVPKMGFQVRLRERMKECTGSAMFSILINVSQKGFISSSRGLRQGEPLSLSLFIIVRERLSRMQEKASSSELLRGFICGSGDLHITHLQFVDENPILCDVEEEQAKNVKA